MKARWLSVPAIVVLILSAGRPLTATLPDTDTQASNPKTAEVLAEKTGCLQCHSANKQVKGPSFHDIAERYKNDANGRAWLVEKVKKGGRGKWTNITGGIPMPAHSKILTPAEIERLVDWVRSF
jgi:cytochrome c